MLVTTITGVWAGRASPNEATGRYTIPFPVGLAADPNTARQHVDVTTPFNIALRADPNYALGIDSNIVPYTTTMRSDANYALGIDSNVITFPVGLTQ